MSVTLKHNYVIFQPATVLGAVSLKCSGAVSFKCSGAVSFITPKHGILVYQWNGDDISVLALRMKRAPDNNNPNV